MNVEELQKSVRTEAIQDEFKASYWTIKLKMVLINSLAIVTSVSIMIFLATYFFKRDSQDQIKLYALQITDTVGTQVKYSFSSIVEKINLLYTTLQQDFKNPEQKSFFVDLFFKNDKEFFMLGVYKKEGNNLVSEEEVYSEDNLEKSKLTPPDFAKLVRIQTTIIFKAFTGKAVINNASSILNTPAFLLAIPIGQNKERILLTVVQTAKINEPFASKGGGEITETFLVNEEGDVIAHPKEKLVQNGQNLYKIPIVKEMLKSRESTNQRLYKDPESKENFIGSYTKIGFAGAGVVSIVSEKKALKGVYQIQRRNLIIMGIALCLAFAIIYNFARTITRPILRLLQATKEIQQGNFEVAIRPDSRDEVGLLTDSFIRMSQGLQEREKAKDALARFVNPEIAEMALRQELKLGGERKMAVIFFSDIRSFTAISEKLSPEEVIEFLNEYMTAMVSCINETGGTVDKYIGDAIMATWGVPISKGNDAENAINGTLMMRQALLKFNQGRGTAHKPIIKIGCGLNYGPVVAGQMGSSEKLQYTVIGDAVNLASRVEPLNKPFGTDILITQDLYNEVKDIFRVEKMKAIKVKGKADPQSIYAVLGRIDDPNCPQSIDEMRNLVGIDFHQSPPAASPKAGDDEEEVKYEILD
ncbi:MAG: adenylate/guanylate cyclase domain-containing protein [Spirochaetota bacterium]